MGDRKMRPSHCEFEILMMEIIDENEHSPQPQSLIEGFTPQLYKPINWTAL